MRDTETSTQACGTYINTCAPNENKHIAITKHSSQALFQEPYQQLPYICFILACLSFWVSELGSDSATAFYQLTNIFFHNDLNVGLL